MHQLPHPYPVFHRPRAQGSSRIRLCAYHLLQLPSKREVRLMTNELAETLWGRLSTCGRLAIGPLPLPLRLPTGGGNQPPRRLPTCPTVIAFLALTVFLSLVAQAQPVKDTFRIKYVAEGAVYIEGGRTAGLAEKMRLTVSKPPDVTIELEVVSVADSSAVCEIKTPGAALLQPGDFAKLTSEDGQKSQMLRQMGSGNHYAQTITFTGGDPIDEEAREYVPRPPLPEVNRFRGRIGFEYSGIIDQGGSGASSQVGLVLRSEERRVG